MDKSVVLVKGGGDLGTGVALRLFQHDYRIVVTELPQPLVVRRKVAVASAVYEERVTIEGVEARRVQDIAGIRAAWAAGHVPVIVDPETRIAQKLRPCIVVDAIMAKRNVGTTIHAAPIVVALGPGFCAGVDCHAVVETQRGPNLGRVYFEGSTAPDSGVPGEIGGEAIRRVLRAPIDGTFVERVRIGELVRAGDVVGQVNDQPVTAAIAGVVRGLLTSGVAVRAGTKVGDIDPRGDPALCRQVSDKAWKVADGVLEALAQLVTLSGVVR
jgi:xanthine dehydrogenase accessory factor